MASCWLQLIPRQTFNPWRESIFPLSYLTGFPPAIPDQPSQRTTLRQPSRQHNISSALAIGGLASLPASQASQLQSSGQRAFGRLWGTQDSRCEANMSAAEITGLERDMRARWP